MMATPATLSFSEVSVTDNVNALAGPTGYEIPSLGRVFLSALAN